MGLLSPLLLHVAGVLFGAIFVRADQNETQKLDDFVSTLANHEQRNYCLNHADAQQIAQNYGLLQTAFSTELADAALSPDFSLYSTSLNTLTHECEGSDTQLNMSPLTPTFSSREAFKAGQGSQPSVQFSQLDLWYACDTVIIRYEIPSGEGFSVANPTPIVGMIDLRTTPAPVGNQYPYYIQTVYSEFNVAAYLANLKETNLCQSTVTPASAATSSSTVASSSAATNSNTTSP